MSVPLFLLFAQSYEPEVIEGEFHTPVAILISRANLDAEYELVLEKDLTTPIVESLDQAVFRP